MNTKHYFGIVVIASVMLGAMILSSCNHDDYYYSEEKAEQAVNGNYAAAFEKAFGKVGPNVDWGFNSKKTNARAFTRAGGVTFSTTITFPGDYKGTFNPDLTEIPSYENYLKSLGTLNWTPEEFGYGEVYIDKVQTIKINGGTAEQRSKLYVKAGTYDFTDVSFYLGKYVDLFLLEGATLKLDNTVAANAIFDIYIAEGAELIANGSNGLVANSGAHVYNHGTITCSKFEANTTSVLYNSGTVKATGTVSAESNSTDGINNLSFIVNNGNFECADVVVNAGAVLNIFDWKVSGTTHINSNNSGWINNGQWTTTDYAYLSGSENAINNCLLTVTNDFEMNISSVKGAFKINSEGGVLTTNFYGGRDSSTDAISGPFKIMMASNAVFVVSETAQFESGRGSIGDNYEYGIFGPSTGEYAVFQAKNIVREPTLANTWGAVTYGGNLYVSAETHFAQGNDGMAAHKFIFEQDGFSIANNIYAADFKSGKPNITIPKTECSPGFKGGNPLYRVIAEDLSASEAGDFDFNDVVFDVVKAEGGKTTLRLICAGGTLPLKVMEQEVHGLFGETAPNAQGLYRMYNTGAGPNVDPVEFTIDGTFTTPEQIKNIIIKVYKNGSWMELKATTGEAACKILVDDTFKPVVERRNIADENKKFTNYVQGKFVDDFWWK